MPPCWHKCKNAGWPLILIQQQTVQNKSPKIVENDTQYNTHTCNIKDGHTTTALETVHFDGHLFRDSMPPLGHSTV